MNFSSCSFYSWMVFHCMDVTQVLLSIHQLTHRHLGCCHISCLFLQLNRYRNPTACVRWPIVYAAFTVWQHCTCKARHHPWALSREKSPTPAGPLYSSQRGWGKGSGCRITEFPEIWEKEFPGQAQEVLPEVEVTQGQGPPGGQGECLRIRTKYAKAQEPGQAWRFQNMHVEGLEERDRGPRSWCCSQALGL